MVFVKIAANAVTHSRRIVAVQLNTEWLVVEQPVLKSLNTVTEGAC